MHIGAIFFDLDGILIDSEAAWREASEEAFAVVGIALDDALYTSCAGLDTGAGVRAVLARFPDCRADQAEVRRDIEERVRHRLAEEPRAMPGVEALLAELQRRGVPLAVVSASPPALIAQVLAARRWRPCFRVVLSSEEVGPGKPDPAVYREAARRLAVAPSDGLAVEDSLAGVLSAHGAGLRVLAVPSYALEREAIARLAAHVARDMPAACAWLLAALADGSTAAGA
jgi:HAD superfamily hydrolase (TIGR01509 family)